MDKLMPKAQERTSSSFSDRGDQILRSLTGASMKSRLEIRIVLPSLGISILLLALGGCAAWYVYRQQEQASVLLDKSVSCIRTAEGLVSACREMRYHLGQYSITGASASLDALTPVSTVLSEHLARGEALAESEEERQLLGEIRSGSRQLQHELAVLADTPESNRKTQANQLGYDIITEKMLRPATEYLGASNAGIDRSRHRNQALAGRVALSFLLLGVCGAVAGLVTGYAVARGLRQRLFQLHVPIRTATGKLDEVIGPFEVSEPHDLQDLDSVLATLAERVAVVADRLQESQLELLRAEQLAALGQLAAGLAHELRNPLTSMKILVQTAAEAGENAALEGRDVAVLEEELTRLERSIQRFLDFARPPKLEKGVFDICHVLRQIVELVSGRAARQQALVQCELPEVPVEIFADGEQIRQLLLNTVLNALDAAGHGGMVHLGLSRNGDKGKSEPWVVISVRDDGPGVPVELGERIFEPFVSTKDTGLGLGLAICRRIAEAHQGKIQAANQADGGALFTICLPLRTPASSVPHQE